MDIILSDQLPDNWKLITEDMKIIFKSEFRNEVGPLATSKLSCFLSLPHPLAHLEVYAIATAQANDDVLFEFTDSKDSHTQYIVVHLTWKASRERDGWPRYARFCSFEEFYEAYQEDWD